MRDLNHRNEFAWKSERTGRFFRIDHPEALARLQRGEEIYEKVMPDCSVTPREKAQIPWTLATLTER